MTTENQSPARIGISIGDVGGIGMEVILKTFQDTAMLQVCIPVLYGSAKVLSFHRKALGMEEFNYSTIRTIGEVNPRKVNLLNAWDEEVKIEFGKPTEESGRYAMRSLEAACKDLGQQKIDALVTAPVDKQAISREHPDFTGHTGYLARTFDAPERLMILVSDLMRVSFVTGHVPLKEVAARVTAEKIGAALRLLQRSLHRDFGIRKPKIAVLGLNPHAGDSGLIGDEEETVIRPAVQQAFDGGMLVYGPYPADGFFGAAQFKKFDAVLAMYHDQGLAPFKALTFGQGVNFTAGLPVVRTSPDHGTAFDIAGKNQANPDSFRRAVFLACDILRQRKDYDQAHANPLAYSTHRSDR